MGGPGGGPGGPRYNQGPMNQMGPGRGRGGPPPGPPPGHGRNRMNPNNGGYGSPGPHGPHGQRIPGPPGPPNSRMGNGNGRHFGGRGPPPPPPNGRMNPNFGQPNPGQPFHQHQPPPRHQQQHPQQFFPQHPNVPNGQHGPPNPQMPYPYPHQKPPSYQSMGNQPMAPQQHQPHMPMGQMPQHGILSAPTGPIINQHQPPPMMGVGPPSVIPSNPSDVVTNWSTHKAPTGDDYFYNSVTQESTYIRPTCLGGPPAITNIAMASSAIPPAAAITTSATTVPQASMSETRSSNGWSQHTDKSSGKVYYYNGTITTWDKPDDFDDPTATSMNETSAPPAKKKKKNTEPTVIYNNKAEAIAAFKGLLLAKDISPTMKWNEVVKICSTDARWEACTTTGERKQSLAEYQTKRANVLREEKRQEKMRAKDAFMSLLTDVLPTIAAFDASSGTSFQEIRDSISKDDRFYAVEQEERREELFQDFLEEVRKKDERQRRGRKRDAKEAFLSFLKSKELLTFTSTWSSFVKTLDENEKVDKRFVVSPSMSDSERQLYFADHVIELTAIEDEKRRRIREARRRAEKAQRNAFRDTLKQYARDGKILPTSRWRNVEEAITAEDTYDPVKEQDRDEPRNIFDDFIDEWSEIYHGDKGFLNSLLSKTKDLTLSTDTKYEDFTKALLDAAAYSPDAYSDARRVVNDEIPVSSAKLFFDEIVASGKFGSSRARPGLHGRRIAEDSSEDEGEIIEDGEVLNDGTDPENIEARIEPHKDSSAEVVNEGTKPDEEP